MTRSFGWTAFVAAALAVGCMGGDPVGVSLQEMRIPGDWVPPEAVFAAANGQYVEVVEPPSIAPLGYCPEPGTFTTCVHPACTAAHPGTTEIANYIFGRWSFARNSGTYSCRRNSGNTSHLSVHAIGRAIDIGIATIDGDADNTRGDEIANWLIANAEHIGVQRVIWDGMYWTGSRRNDHFREMCDTRAECGGRTPPDHHVNHIHLEVSVAAGRRETAFFRSGPPARSCPVVCYGTAAVAEDCSYVDCAASGEVCMSDPVRCEPGPPPEPELAVHQPDAPLPTVVPRGLVSRLALIEPVRLFDTRMESPLTPAAPRTLSTIDAIEPGTTAIWMNVAAIPRMDPGFIVVHPSGPAPMISTVNFAPPRVRANGVAVPINAGGVTFTPSTEVDAVADLNAAFSPTAGLGLRTGGPRRVFDSRSLDAIVRDGTPLAIDLGAPPGAVGVIASLAVVQNRDAAGFLTAFACGEDMPETSMVNFAANTVTANTIVSGVGRGPAGEALLCIQPSTPVHVVVDVTGVLVPDGELSYQPLAGTRLLDTRSPDGLYVGRLGRGQTIELPIAAIPGMPDDVRAVTVNLTTISPGERGHVVAYPCDLPGVPETSNLNFDSDNPAAAIAVSRLSADGRLCLYSIARTFLVVDLLGAWVPTPDAPEPTDVGGPTFLPEDPEAGRGFDAPDEASDMERGVDTTGDPALREDDRDHEGDWVPYGGGSPDPDPDPTDPGGGGCSAGQGRPITPAALLMIAGLGLAAARRRSRASRIC